MDYYIWAVEQFCNKYGLNLHYNHLSDRFQEFMIIEAKTDDEILTVFTLEEVRAFLVGLSYLDIKIKGFENVHAEEFFEDAVQSIMRKKIEEEIDKACQSQQSPQN